MEEDQQEPEEEAQEGEGLLRSEGDDLERRAPGRPRDGILRGSYSYRPGVILATADFYADLIPTGHAALVYSDLYVVEALSWGVALGKNNWYSAKKTAFQATAKSTTVGEDSDAADWAYHRLGKPYNYNYFNISTRGSFYCSQLVWADFLDNFGVNMNTPLFKIKGLGNPIHPLELMVNSKVRLSTCNSRSGRH